MGCTFLPHHQLRSPGHHSDSHPCVTPIEMAADVIMIDIYSRSDEKLLLVLSRQRFAAFVTKAVGDSSDSSSGSIVKFVQSAWNNSEDRIALAGLGFAAIVAFWASTNLIAAIDKLPLIPSTLEFIGILFSWWFIYRYLLFKPDREELATKIKSSISDIIGQ